MATAASVSELRVVLMGNSWSERSSVGNFILGQTVFDTEDKTFCYVKVRGQLKDKEIVLINTPDVLLPEMSEDRLRQYVENCLRISAPGPHVFLLVLQPEHFTEEQKLKLCRVFQLFSDQSFDRSLNLISTTRWDKKQHQPLQDLIRGCRYKYIKLENLDLQELPWHLSQIVINCEEYAEMLKLHLTPKDKGQLICDTKAGLSTELKAAPFKPTLNLVLCGRRGALKTSVVNTILGKTTFGPPANSSECVINQGEVCGRRVSLVELPALYGKPPETMMEESFRCVFLCDPEGVHAFILVLPVGPLTDEDKGELETIQNTFSSRVNDFTMILFTVDSDPTDPAVVNISQENKEIRDLCQSCGGRSVVLNVKDRMQVHEVLDTVEKTKKMVKKNRGSCYTSKMFQQTEAAIEKEVEKILKENEEEMRRKEEELKRKHEEEIGAMKQRMDELLKDIEKNKEQEQEMRREDDENRKKQEDTQRQGWDQRPGDVETKMTPESDETQIKLEHRSDDVRKERRKNFSQRKEKSPETMENMKKRHEEETNELKQKQRSRCIIL
ncbi:hypothetical protein Q5P01_015372 [Channa striata]|uniref:AIG1-type G domain-containing protein n=1 Tax=Channa striata TaxID=64152 RepID=A0AA88SGB4_CHASR|nr:hypothetical protein Q5P01_015372 [Channa striata]